MEHSWKIEFIDAFKEQAACLVTGPVVAGFIIETMIDLREGSMRGESVQKQYRPCPCRVHGILFPDRRRQDRDGQFGGGMCAGPGRGRGGRAIGANCGSIDPEQMAEIVAVMSKSTAPLPIRRGANAGKTAGSPERQPFRHGSSKFADGLMACRQAGARILGGCCGTDAPSHQ